MTFPRIAYIDRTAETWDNEAGVRGRARAWPAVLRPSLCSVGVKSWIKNERICGSSRGRWSTLRCDPVAELLRAIVHLGVLQRLASVRPHLSAAEQAAVSYMLAHPEHAVRMSAGELAQAAGVSEATVFRLCRQLGYSGYMQLRDELAGAVEAYAPSFLAPLVVHQGARAEQRGDNLEPGDEAGGRLARTVYGGIRALVDALAVGDAAIERAADTLCAANRIIFCGVGGYTARIAEMAAFGLQRLGLTCMLWIDAQLNYVTPELFTPEDAVVGISYSGENKAVARFLHTAREVGATTVALTNYKLSPVAKGSDVALVTSFREPSIQNFELLPRLSQLLVVHALIDAVGERLSQRAGRGTNGAR